MILSIILNSSLLLVVLLNFYFSSRYFRYYNGRIFLTSIPINNIDDVDIKNLCSNLYKKFKIFNLLSLIPVLISIFVNNVEYFIIFFMVFLFLYMGISAVIINSGIKEIRKIKKGKNFTKLGSRIYVDFKLSSEINKKQINIFNYAIIIAIYLIGIFAVKWLASGLNNTTIIIYNLINILCITFVGLLFRKIPIKIVSDSEETNRTFNILKKIKLQEITFTFLCIYVLFATVFNYFSQSFENIIPMFILSTVLLVFYFVVIAVYSNRIEKSIFDNIEDDKFFYEEEDCYDIWGYKNPNDSRIFLQDPVNSMQYTINRGNKNGKILFSTVNLLLGILVIFCIYIAIPSDYDIKIEDNKLKIHSKMYNDIVNLEEIESIELVDSLPEKLIRTSGIATGKQLIGNFASEGKAHRLYTYSGEKFIKITTKNGKSIYVNGKNVEETEKLFDRIKLSENS